MMISNTINTFTGASTLLDILLLICILLCRILTSATLLIAGMAKMRNGQGRLVQIIMGYELVPKSMAAVLARYLPWLEVLSGAMLLVGVFSQAAALTAFALFLLFNGAIAASLLRGKDNDCVCFGKISPVQWPGFLFRLGEFRVELETGKNRPAPDRLCFSTEHGLITPVYIELVIFFHYIKSNKRQVLTNNSTIRGALLVFLQ